VSPYTFAHKSPLNFLNAGLSQPALDPCNTPHTLPPRLAPLALPPSSHPQSPRPSHRRPAHPFQPRALYANQPEGSTFLMP
jgi:hypothetical protein